MTAFTSNLLWETPVDPPQVTAKMKLIALLYSTMHALFTSLAAYSARSPSLILPILANFRATSRDPGYPDRAIEEGAVRWRHLYLHDRPYYVIADLTPETL